MEKSEKKAAAIAAILAIVISLLIAIFTHPISSCTVPQTGTLDVQIGCVPIDAFRTIFGIVSFVALVLGLISSIIVRVYFKIKNKKGTLAKSISLGLLIFGVFSALGIVTMPIMWSFLGVGA